MLRKIITTLALVSIFLHVELSAQQNVYFTGLGRALVTNDGLSDESNLASRKKASGGYTIFDLGIYANPNEVLRGGVILRTRNEFGGFFSDGAKLEFRQMQLEGLISKKVKYEIGDIYLSHTRYTLWSEETVSPEYEANVFSLRRGIVNYENFFVGNAWRMQGFNAKSKINFSKGVDSLRIRVYGGRTMETDFASIPDRYFYGGRLDLVQSKYFRIAGNLASVSDIAGTVKEAQVDYDNTVFTSDFDLTLEKEKIKIVLKGEAGISQFSLDRTIDTAHFYFEDFFYDGGLEAVYKPLNISVGLSYRDVGYNFNSPMAQSRRLAQPGNITLGAFPLLNDNLTSRAFTLFDTYSQEQNIYNRSISTTLMNYFVQYDIVEPYGQATPNRKGFTATASIKEPSEIIKAGIEVDMLSEGVSEGDSVTTEKRKFTKIQGGLVFNLNKVIGFEKLIAISSGIRTESVVRGGTNPVDLSNSLLDLGLDVEVLKGLHLLGGAKFFNVKGNEFQTGRDELNQIVSFGTGTNFNQTQQVIATGLRYDYDKVGYFSAHYHTTEFTDKDVATSAFTLNQLFFVFGLKF